MSDNTMLSPAAGGRRASLRQQQKNVEGLNGLDLTEDMQQQEEEAEDQPTPTGGKKNQAKEERTMEQFQLAEMVRDNYAVLVGEDREQKEKVWQNIFDECKKGLNHKWTQGKDCGYLRKSYWPNMKCKALANHGKSNATELQEFVYSFISQVPMENADVVEESPEKKTASATRNAKKPAQVMATNLQNSTPVNTMSVGALVGSGRVPSRRSKRISDPRQHLSDEQFSPLNFTPPPGSRQSSQLSSINTNGGTEEPIARQNGGGTKRRASQELTDLNTNSSTSNGEQDDGIAMDTTGGSTSEMSDLEKELLQARMELCEAKARVCEAEANIQRLEKATWEEMLKKGKKAKMGQ